MTELADELVVITNFGLLTRRDEGWLLTCEERIGGLILTVEGDPQGGFVSTSRGLFEWDGDVCTYRRAASSERSEWLLDYAFAPGDESATDGHFALVLDPSAATLGVERAEGDRFEVLREFPADSGYDAIEAAGVPARVYVAGYENDPRAWRLAFARDDGETWVELRPEVDLDYTTMALLGADPDDPDSLFVQAQTVAGSGHQLWRFDARSQAIEQLLLLDAGEVMGGFAFDGDRVWVAGRRRDGGSLYRADREELVFERVVADGPAFECLAAFSGELYACVNDFTYASTFVLGASRDGGETWTPELTLSDLGSVESCGDDCALTADQLHADYGVALEPDPSASERDAAPSDPEPDVETKPSACALAPPVDSSPAAGVGFLGLVACLLGRRRLTARRPFRSGSAAGSSGPRLRWGWRRR